MDIKRRSLEFHPEDKVYLRVSLTRGVMRFGEKENLSPRYIGPVEILQKVGRVAYQLALPPTLSQAHNIFHVSQLRIYLYDPSHVLEPEPLLLKENLNYEEFPLRIVDHKEQVLRRRSIPLLKCNGLIILSERQLGN
ncbi:hypothetical protein Sango_0374000 [Sesamum angolense]|uniref:Tf2-1-like SH3-like domain-containing protein n=1 Tax=Sesamum angolense TaxID=2727404 RepID=A0AAE2C423_9LAMI|nr:hypothetical protein Sango_0374000 [Sesamum angolense]